jgi:hypothetical protein
MGLGHDDPAWPVDEVPEHRGEAPAATSDADRDLVVGVLVGDAGERESLTGRRQSWT